MHVTEEFLLEIIKEEASSVVEKTLPKPKSFPRVANLWEKFKKLIGWGEEVVDDTADVVATGTAKVSAAANKAGDLPTDARTRKYFDEFVKDANEALVKGVKRKPHLFLFCLPYLEKQKGAPRLRVLKPT